MGQTGINLDQVKKKNRSYILRTINDEGPISKKDIAGKLNLTSASLTQTCAPMLEEGLIYEAGISEDSTGPGRKKVLLDINFDYQQNYAFIIEPDKTTVAVTNLRGDLKGKRTIDTDNTVSAEKFLARISQIALELKEKAGITEDILLAAVCISGPVDSKRKVSLHAYGIWDEEVEIGKILEEKLGAEVIVENNVTAFALAEIYFGLGRKNDNLFFVKWGPGLGAAIVIDKKIYEGELKKTAEIGHFVVQRNGEKCSCGRRGCLETKLSFSAVKRDIAGVFSKEFTPKLYELLGGDLDNLTMEFPEEYFKDLDPALTEILAKRIILFSQVIVNCMTILSPNKVVLCGPLFKNPFLREKVIEGCSYFDPYYNGENVIYTELADKETYIGAAALCAKKVLFGDQT